MTSGHPVRHVLARICSADTMARIVDPTFADMRWESARPAWRGYFALLKALTAHAVMSTPGALGRMCAEDGHAVPRIAAYTIAGAVVAATLLIAPTNVGSMIRRAHSQGVDPFLLGLLLLPQGLALTLPAALLLAIPLALRDQQPSARLARRTLAVSLACAAATFVLIAWMMPAANQSFRVLMNANQPVQRGLNETGFAALREQIERLKSTEGGRVAARRIEHVYQTRLLLVCAPLPLWLLSVALSATPTGRRRPWLVGVAGLSFYVLVLFGLTRVLMRTPVLPDFMLAWTVLLFIAIAAAMLVARFPSGFFDVPSFTKSR